MDPTKKESKLKTVISNKRNGGAPKPSLAKNEGEKILSKRTRTPNSRYLVDINVQSVDQSKSVAVEKSPSRVSLEVTAPGRNGKGPRKTAAMDINVTSVEQSKPVEVGKVPSGVSLKVTAPVRNGKGAGKKAALDINVPSMEQSKPVAVGKMPSGLSLGVTAPIRNCKGAGKKATRTKVNKSDSHRADSGRDVPKKHKKYKKVRYEVDCTNVDIDIVDFQAYLQLQMIVARKKNNEHLKVKSRGKTIIVRSAIYVSKDTVRFVTKKYLKLKKMNSVRVLSKAKDSYRLTHDN